MITRRPGLYGFMGLSRYLSNFFIEPDGSHVEGEFQRAKAAISSQREWFHTSWPDGPLKPPAHCKAIGRKVTLRPDWEDVKVGIMTFYVTKKFKDHAALAQRLMSTGTLYLEETNTWGDKFWGVCDGKGQNILGEILMGVRSQLIGPPEGLTELDYQKAMEDIELVEPILMTDIEGWQSYLALTLGRDVTRAYTVDFLARMVDESDRG